MDLRFSVLGAMQVAAGILRDRHPNDNSPAGNDLTAARKHVVELLDAAKLALVFADRRRDQDGKETLTPTQWREVESKLRAAIVGFGRDA